MFDSGKKGFVDTDRIRTILNTLGQNFDEDELNELIDAHDVEGKFLFRSKKFYFYLEF